MAIIDKRLLEECNELLYNQLVYPVRMEKLPYHYVVFYENIFPVAERINGKPEQPVRLAKALNFKYN